MTNVRNTIACEMVIERVLSAARERYARELERWVDQEATFFDGTGTLTLK